MTVFTFKIIPHLSSSVTLQIFMKTPNLIQTKQYNFSKIRVNLKIKINSVYHEFIYLYTITSVYQKTL